MAEGSGDKAERILGAAARVLAQEGYGGTTVALVAEEAGVSRGLLHYYFESKEDIIAQVLRRNVGRSAEMLRSVAEGAETVEGFARDLTVELRRVATEDPATFMVLAEALSVSRRSEVVGRELKELHGSFTDVLVEAFEGWMAVGVMPAGRPPYGTAVLVTAMVDGLGLDLVAVEGLADEEEVWRAFEEGLARVLG